MSIARAITTSFSQVFSLIGSTAESLEKTIDMGNVIIDNQHKKITRTSTKNAILSTAQHHTDIIKELEADSKLKETFAALEAEWETATVVPSTTEE